MPGPSRQQMKSCIIFNPAARGDKARRFLSRLANVAAHCQLKPTPGPGQARPLAAEAVQQGFDLVIAAGGDGTVNEVLNGINDAPEGLIRTRLAILPLGTANVFALDIGMPANLDLAWSVIQQARETTVDLGAAQFTGAGQPQQRLFVQMAGAGVDSRIIDRVRWEDKKRFGKLAYLAAALRTLRDPKPPITVQTGSETIIGEQVLVGSGRCYAGPYRLFPQASRNDGRLDISILPRASWKALLRGCWGLAIRQLYTAGGFIHRSLPSFNLSSSDSVPFHIDGENVGHLPVQFLVHPRKLRLIVP